MLHILLLILKIIGLILLAVLCLVLLLLVWPVTYAGKMDINDNQFSYHIRAGWFFRIIFLGIYGENADYKGAIRIFGIPVKRLNATKKDKAEKKEKPVNKKEKQKLKKKDKKPKQESMTVTTPDEAGKFTADFSEAAPDEVGKQTDISDSNASDEGVNQEGADKVKQSKIKVFFEKIKNILIQIKNKIIQITKNVKGITNKIIEIKKFLTAKSTKRAYNYGKKIIIKLLRHLRPRKIRADIMFGLEQPDATGKTLGYLAMAFSTLHINPKKIKITPDFEKKIIKGKLEVKGHLILGLVIIYCLKFYFNKDIHRIIKKYQS